MKPRHLSLCLYFACFAVMFFACITSAPGKATQNTARGIKYSVVYHKKNFDNLTAIIEKNSSALDFSEELLADTTFLEIYEHGEAYFNKVNERLQQQHFIPDEAGIWIYAM